MAKPLLCSLLPSDVHPSQAHPTQDRLQGRDPRTQPPSSRAPRISSSARSSRLAKSAAAARTPSAALLALLAALVAEQARAYTPTPLPPSTARFHTREGPACPDVPEFLCPALVTSTTTTTAITATPSTPHPSLSLAPAAAFPFDTGVKKEQQRLRPIARRDDDDDSSSGLASEQGAENSFVVRSSTFPNTASPFSSATTTTTLTHHDGQRPPPHASSSGSQFLEEAAWFINSGNNNASPGRQSFASGTFGNSRSRSVSSKFSSRTRGEDSKQKLKRKKRRLGHRDDDSTTTTTDPTATTSSTTECSQLYTSRTIPDRYELGNDGRWHKLSVSSSCSLCECTSHEVDNEADNDLSATGVTNDVLDDPSISNTATSSDAGESDALTIILPDGWDGRTSSVVYQVPLIVIASLLVAAIVTAAVWFAFFWRRRQRVAKQKALEKDLEKRKKAEGNDSGSEGGEYEDDGSDDGDVAAGRGERRRDRREMRDEGRREKKGAGKAKARWSKAAAEWKAHVRWIHRRKRGRSSIVVDSGKQQQQQQRSDAMASGVSLAQSSASSRSGSSGAELARLRALGTIEDGGRDSSNENETAGVDENAGESVSPSLSDSESASMSNHQSMTGSGFQSGLAFRPRGASATRSRDALRDAGRSSDRRRSADAQVYPQSPSQNASQSLGQVRYQEVPYHASGGNSASSYLQFAASASSPQGPISTSALASTSSSSQVPSGEAWARSDYDRPPPDVSLSETEFRREDGDVHSPPAYRSRRSEDRVTRATARSSRRRRRDEKRAETTGYVPAPEDCAPYSSSEEGGDESEREGGRSSTDSRRLSSDVRQMHVAVDDKQALARLAEYASAPPAPSSPPPPAPPAPTATSTSFSHPPLLPYGPNAPPEPEWERFEDYDYARALGLSGDLDNARDSPGAGPGPSTTYARSRSASPTRLSVVGERTPSYSQHPSPVHPFFPAPPAPISSQLAYAPADAGLVVHPHANLGAGDCEAAMPAEGPSAPPFYPYEARGPGGDVLMMNASAPPPLFAEEADLGGWGGRLESGSGPSAPPEAEVSLAADVDVDDTSISVATACANRPTTPESLLEQQQRRQEDDASTERLPDASHVETSDRNAVPSAVR